MAGKDIPADRPAIDATGIRHAATEMREIDLIGRTREELGVALKDKKRGELVDLIYRLAALEPMFKPRTIAAARQTTRQAIMNLIHTGILRAHRINNKDFRVPLSAIREWDQNTALSLERG